MSVATERPKAKPPGLAAVPADKRRDAEFLLRFMSALPGHKLAFLPGTESNKVASLLVRAGLAEARPWKRGPVRGTDIALRKGAMLP